MVSDSTGRAVFGDLPAASYRIAVRTLGYAPLDTTIRFASDTTVIFRVTSTAVQLEAVGVSSPATQAHLREFEFRRQTKTGRYLVESDLVEEGDRQFAGVAATRFPGLKKCGMPMARFTWQVPAAPVDTKRRSCRVDADCRRA